MSAFTSYVQAKFHGGTMAGGPTFTVVHDAETPLRAGYADSIAEFFRVGPKAGTSAHAMVDPGEAIKLLPDNVVAYAAGPKANPRGWHLEQAGYASFTRAQWTTADGMAQLGRVADCLREIHDQWGIPKRWCTDAQLRAAAAGDRSQGGMTTHQQVARVLGGTTHTDPEDNYPRDLLLAAVLTGNAPTVPVPALESDMQLVKTPDGKVYKVTDLDVSVEPNIYRMFALAKARGFTEGDITPVSYAELQDNAADAAERRARVLGGVAVDVDEAAIVTKLLPAITEAVAGKTGATREEIAELLRGITLRAS